MALAAVADLRAPAPKARVCPVNPARSAAYTEARAYVASTVSRTGRRKPVGIALVPGGRRLTQCGAGRVYAEDCAGQVVRLYGIGHGAVLTFIDDWMGALSARARRRSVGRAQPPRRPRGRSLRASRATRGRALLAGCCAVGPRRRILVLPRHPRGRAPRSGAVPRPGRPVADDIPRSSGTRSRARAIAGTNAGACFSGMCRPAKTTTGSQARAACRAVLHRCLRARLLRHAGPVLGAVGRTTAEAKSLLRHADAAALDRETDAASTGPRYLREYSFDQTSNQSTTIRTVSFPRGPRRGAQK